MRNLTIAVIILCGICLVLLPVTGRRERAAWAKAAFVITGLLALVYAGLSVAIRTGMGGDDEASLQIMRQCRTVLTGTIVGLIISLALSGEMWGRKRTTSSHPL